MEIQQFLGGGYTQDERPFRNLEKFWLPTWDKKPAKQRKRGAGFTKSRRSARNGRRSSR